MNDRNDIEHDPTNRRVKQVFVLFAVIGGFFLVAEHRAHLIPYLPWLFLAACPLMHLFMHHGHGGGREHRDESTRQPNDAPDRAAEPPRHRHGVQS